MDQLRFARFPLGEIAKSEVREKAKNLGLTVAEKRQSGYLFSWQSESP